jgi:undecaprenyl diphosphate synthase
MEEPDTAANDPTGVDIPRHVAIIMDGNGRWAQARSQPRHAGHRAGVKSVRATVEIAAERGVSYLTLFAFSSENWQRPQDEVSRLMGLFLEALQREVDDLHRNNVRLRFVGARRLLRPKLVRRIEAAEEQTKANTGLSLIVAVAYGGRWDIVNAAKRLAGKVARGEMSADEIDEDGFNEELAMAGIPDPDLLIRTGGEQRISNFLLWNLAYSELYFTDCLWPDFRQREFGDAMNFYRMRQRRYGHTAEQVEAV